MNEPTQNFAPVWPDREARFYALALDQSDYRSAAGTALAAVLAPPASLLDIGAGAGHPLLDWLPPEARWTALEPNRYLRARLSRLARTGRPGLLPCAQGWQDLFRFGLHELAFAANIGATLEAPRALLAAMRSRASRAVIWVVPAQHGPKRWCLSGALPAALHGEDETPAVERVLAALGDDAPTSITSFGWTFRASFADHAAAEAYCADRLRLPSGDSRRAAIRDHVAQTARALPEGGVGLAAPKRSALLVWKLGALALALLSPATAGAQQPAPVAVDEVVVTATSRPEPRSQIAGTVQVVDEETIRRSTARNLTDLLAEQGVGFFSEWSPGQTSINIRGGATDGQGRDFRSQVLVLVNGRRAGTANLSKLSPSEVERIEVVRGPASVVYGSQAIGGVINLIMRDARSSPGGFVEGAAGSWGLAEGRARYGGTAWGLDYYAGLSGSMQDDYRVGGGARLGNTAYQHRGFATAFGGEIGALGYLGLSARSDGIYDAGFRGSGWNLFNHDDRRNHSADLTLNGALPNKLLSWNLQAYAVRDQDDFHWNSPITRGSTGLPAPGTLLDSNERTLDIIGTRLQPVLRPWSGGELLLGLDLEYSALRSDRYRIAAPGAPTAQVPPIDNNQTDRNAGLYAELSQRFIGDRLTLRGGVRRNYGTTSFDSTPNLALQRSRDVDYEATTWSAGATFRLLPSLVLRANAATGFRAPTATELAADFTALGGGRTFGNPDLKPETNEQYEIGAALYRPGLRLDLALFQNTIHDRITTQLRSGVANTSDYANNPGDILVRGLEAQAELDFARWLGWTEWRWRGTANAAWNFDMQDRGAAASANRHVVERMYRWQAGIGTTFGQGDRWDVTVQGILRGEVFYNSEENLLIPNAEPNREHIHRKGAYGLVNLRGSVQILPESAPGLRVFGAINNLLDRNYHALFIATEDRPYLSDPRFSNGGRGNSAPGWEFIAGLRASF
jgi:vitamin B12 transporter